MKRIRKTVEVDIDETVDVTVSLGLNEIVQFVQNCNSDEKAEIRQALKDDNSFGHIRTQTLDDVMKMETLIKLFNKYSQSELDNFL